MGLLKTKDYVKLIIVVGGQIFFNVKRVNAPKVLGSKTKFTYELPTLDLSKNETVMGTSVDFLNLKSMGDKTWIEGDVNYIGSKPNRTNTNYYVVVDMQPEDYYDMSLIDLTTNKSAGLFWLGFLMEQSHRIDKSDWETINNFIQ